MAAKSCVRPVAAGLGALAALVLLISGVFEAVASCGSASCFMITGEESAVQPKGQLSMGLQYAYTISKVAKGSNGRVTSVDQESRQLVLDEHAEHRTIGQTVLLNVDYGLTDRLTLEALLPYRRLKHTHVVDLGNDNGGFGTDETFQHNGMGDVRVGGKYSILPTLRSLIVLGFGVDLPTGNSHTNNNNGRLQEPTLQMGRRAFGIAPSVYQSYEVIPHLLNQFASASYRHTFGGPNSYRFGDEYVLSGGLNVRTLKIVTLTGQFNWRYAVHDEFTGRLAKAQDPNADAGTFPDEPIVIDSEVKRRPVGTTGSTMLAFSPGISVALRENLRAYFFAQIPVVRDFNGGLVPDTGFLFGLSMSVN